MKIKPATTPLFLYAAGLFIYTIIDLDCVLNCESRGSDEWLNWLGMQMILWLYVVLICIPTSVIAAFKYKPNGAVKAAYIIMPIISFIYGMNVHYATWPISDFIQG